MQSRGIAERISLDFKIMLRNQIQTDSLSISNYSCNKTQPPNLNHTPRKIPTSQKAIASLATLRIALGKSLTTNDCIEKCLVLAKKCWLLPALHLELTPNRADKPNLQSKGQYKNIPLGIKRETIKANFEVTIFSRDCIKIFCSFRLKVWF